MNNAGGVTVPVLCTMSDIALYLYQVQYKKSFTVSKFWSGHDF